jgi:hypothetical protein
MAMASAHGATAPCSLIVKVINPGGQQIDSQIVVREKDGQRHTAENQIGGARFCNLGLMPVDIEIGDEACNQVIIRNAHLAWSTSTIVTAIYDIEPCLRDLPRGNACEILFRVFGPDGITPVASVTIEALAPFRKQLSADEHGRALVSTRFGSNLIVTMRAPGFAASNVEVRCTAQTARQEQKVVLKRTDASR